MALDYMAIISNGTYPTPTPTGKQRVAYAASLGMLGVIPTGELASPISHILEIGKAGLRIAAGILRIG